MFVRTLLLSACLLLPANLALAQDQQAPQPQSHEGITVPLSPGFTSLVTTAPDVVGMPLEAEHPGDEEGSTVARTTTGLLYWSPEVRPSWTDGYNRITSNGVESLVRWAGELLAPPPPPPPAVRTTPQVECIIGRESGGVDKPNNQGSGADGPGQYFPRTWARHVGYYRKVTGDVRPMSLHNINDVRAVMTVALGPPYWARSEWSVSGC